MGYVIQECLSEVHTAIRNGNIMEVSFHGSIIYYSGHIQDQASMLVLPSPGKDNGLINAQEVQAQDDCYYIYTHNYLECCDNGIAVIYVSYKSMNDQ